MAGLIGILSAPELEATIRSSRLDLIRIRFHRSSRLGLVLSDPTPELRTAGPLWTVERGEGSRAHSLSGQRAGTLQFQTEYMYMTERHIKKKRDPI